MDTGRFSMMILADDLTGAMDVGLQAVLSGRSVVIRLYGMAGTGLQEGISTRRADESACSDLVVLSSESRNLPSAIAKERVRFLMDQSIHQHGPIQYKKVDSTLRGNLGAELESLFQAGRHDLILFAPSLPAAGRIVRHGTLLLNGIPITDTDLSKDPYAPVESPYPAVVIQRQTDMPIGHLTIETVRRGGVSVFQQLMEHYGAGRKIIVADAETDADLQTLAQAMGCLPLNVLPCGSAGFLSAMLSGTRRTAVLNGDRRVVGVPVSQKPWLVLSASPADATRRQIRQAEHYGFKTISPSTEIPGVEHLAREVRQVLSGGNDVLVDLAGESKEKIGHRYRNDPQGLHRAGQQIGAAAAFLTRNMLESDLFSHLALFGGDTAQAVLSGLGAVAVRIGGAVEPTVPWGVIVGGAADGRLVVTKAGGFGSDEILKKIKTEVRHA